MYACNIIKYIYKINKKIKRGRVKRSYQRLRKKTLEALTQKKKKKD